MERGTLFLRGQNRSTNEMSGMILEVQNRRVSSQACGVRQRMSSKVFISKNSRGLKNFIFFVERVFKLPPTLDKTRQQENFEFIG